MNAPRPLPPTEIRGAITDSLVGLHRENARLLALLKEAREALEPFADVDGEGDEHFADSAKVTITFGRTTHYPVTLGDLRRARTTLSKLGDGG